MRLSAGSTLGPYQISGPIGAGGMGEVYRARDTRLDREVAIKVLPREVTADPQRLARFEREARSASALNHPNIVTIHDFTSGDGETWLVMEFVRGESLRDILAKGPVPLKRLLPIAVGVAEGLTAAHAVGIVHRDLKPENVMVTSNGVAKILDFGLAKTQVIDSVTNSPTDLQVSRAGVILGTAGYMSPEQARGAPVDFRSDQFSLGLIIHEMTTGKHPFRRTTPFEMLSAILNEDTPPLGQAFPERLIEIVERCLAKNPAERYGATSDLAHDLKTIRGESVALGRPSTRERARRYTVTAALIGIAAVVIAAFVLKKRPPETLRSMQVSIATPEIAQLSYSEVSVPVTISPDGKYLVIDGTGTDGTSRLWLHDLDSAITRPLAGTENAFGMAWSPDSRSITYFAESKLKTIGLAGGPPRVICDAEPEGFPDWNGETVVFPRFSAGGLFRVSSAGGTPKRFVVHGPDRPGLSHSEFAMWPQFLPGGKRFLYLRGWRTGKGFDHELMVGSLDDETPKGLAAIGSRVMYANGHLLFVHDGVLLAQPFDVRELRLTGQPKALVDQLSYFRSTGMASFGASQNGLVVWAAASQPRSRLIWLDRKGVDLGSVGEGVFAGGRLSPDGRRYAAGLIDKQGLGDVWIYDLVRQTAARLTYYPLDEKAPVWSPDGGSIHYRSDAQGPPDIFRWNFGENQGTPLYIGPGVEEPQDVSPDGRWLLYIEHNRVSRGDVFALPIEPMGKPREIARTLFNELSPRFSPNGKWVAYESDVSGELEVYVRPFEGSATPVRISKEGGRRPRWSRDGRELFYLASNGRLMVTPVHVSGNDFEPGTPQVLFQKPSLADFEVAPDSKRFLAQLEESSGVPPLRLLINWPARLRAN